MNQKAVVFTLAALLMLSLFVVSTLLRSSESYVKRQFEVEEWRFKILNNLVENLEQNYIPNVLAISTRDAFNSVVTDFLLPRHISPFYKSSVGQKHPLT